MGRGRGQAPGVVWHWVSSLGVDTRGAGMRRHHDGACCQLRAGMGALPEALRRHSDGPTLAPIRCPCGANMHHQCLSNHLSQFYWNGVTDHTAKLVELDSGIRGDELIVTRKRLEHRRLSQGDGAILLWVPKSAVAKAETLRRNRWRCLVPFHPSVDARVSLSTLLCVAR